VEYFLHVEPIEGLQEEKPLLGDYELRIDAVSSS
jgi:hypothetical protein